MPETSPSLLLVGDTVVTFGDKILGKPRSDSEACQMLRELSGRTHRVWTGFRIGLFQDGKILRESGLRQVESLVTFHSLAKSEIEDYVRKDRPLDKAGAYGFQDGALRFVARVVGSYTNIVGLPIFDVVKVAQEIGAR